MIDWTTYAESFAAFKTPPLGRLFNGIMTLTLPDGGHRTFRIKTQYADSWMPGKRTIGILVGPDNCTDYEMFGFVETEGIRIFKRILGTGDEASAYKRYADVLWRMAGGEAIPGYEVLESRHCLRCNRLLTDEESIMTGLGPTCRGRE